MNGGERKEKMDGKMEERIDDRMQKDQGSNVGEDGVEDKE